MASPGRVSEPADAADLLANRGAAERAQAQLQHNLVGRRDVSTIRIVCNVIQGEDEAIVDIAKAEAGLVELFGVEIVAGAAQQHPIGV